MNDRLSTTLHYITLKFIVKNS